MVADTLMGSIEKQKLSTTMHLNRKVHQCKQSPVHVLEQINTKHINNLPIVMLNFQCSLIKSELQFIWFKIFMHDSRLVVIIKKISITISASQGQILCTTENTVKDSN
jgi:hypothetical protein